MDERLAPETTYFQSLEVGSEPGPGGIMTENFEFAGFGGGDYLSIISASRFTRGRCEDYEHC